MTPTLTAFLAISAALFCIGLLAALSRRHAIFILIGIEMMLAAAEAAVGLALVIAVYRHYRTTSVDKFDQLKG